MTEDKWKELIQQLADADALDGTCPFSGPVLVEMNPECISSGYGHCAACKWFENRLPQGDMSRLTGMLIDDAMLLFAEPHEAGGDCLVSICAAKAVAWQRKVREYPSDEAALDDFITTHWATPKEPFSIDDIPTWWTDKAGHEFRVKAIHFERDACGLYPCVKGYSRCNGILTLAWRHFVENYTPVKQEAEHVDADGTD